MVKPRYQELKSDEIPKPSQDGVTVAVISGEALGIKVSHAVVCLRKLRCAVTRDWATLGLQLWFSQFPSQGVDLLQRCQNQCALRGPGSFSPCANP